MNYNSRFIETDKRVDYGMKDIIWIMMINGDYDFGLSIENVKERVNWKL